MKIGVSRNSDSLSRREREILDILYRLGKANVGEVRREITGQPHYSTVRAILRVLEAKGHVYHKEADLKYVYMPAVSKKEAARAALVHLLRTFFDNSPAELLRYLQSAFSPCDLGSAPRCETRPVDQGSQRAR